ncbi:hypothetical protein F7725_000648 [Dissostichus mawsoni]|uniref:Uncharacterized protein n=1 Tax=Dissostichus mawsoni TaxID=36200 RepID=A0A7J5ZFM3_DISMA|nr:hypothetical protein F7725_000648 [Dissostichus mawsoni]
MTLMTLLARSFRPKEVLSWSTDTIREPDIFFFTSTSVVGCQGRGRIKHPWRGHEHHPTSPPVVGGGKCNSIGRKKQKASTGPTADERHNAVAVHRAVPLPVEAAGLNSEPRRSSHSSTVLCSSSANSFSEPTSLARPLKLKMLLLLLWRDRKGEPGILRRDWRADLDVFLMSLELIQHGLEFLLLPNSLFHGGLVLLLVSHGHHSQDQIHQVERAHKDHQHKEEHVGLPCRPQRLWGGSAAEPPPVEAGVSPQALCGTG